MYMVCISNLYSQQLHLFVLIIISHISWILIPYSQSQPRTLTWEARVSLLMSLMASHSIPTTARSSRNLATIENREKVTQTNKQMFIP